MDTDDTIENSEFDCEEFEQDHLRRSDYEIITNSYSVTQSDVGMRLDKLASSVFDGFSRATLQKMIEAGELTVNAQTVKSKTTVKFGDILELTTKLYAHSDDLPENIALDIVYEDDEVVVINKPAGLVVHPGAGNRTGTLVNGLLYHYPAQAHLPRAGLVHRIDKDTTGLLVVAKTAAAQLNLIAQLKDKSVYRHYKCVVKGTPSEIARHRTIDAPIARHATVRTKMAIRQTGKPAITHITNITALNEQYCLLDVRLETGRTHQIRVHLSSVGHPLVGDKVYGSNTKKLDNMVQQQAIDNFSRQALHAYELGFIHPVSAKKITVTAPLPDDLQALIEILQS